MLGANYKYLSPKKELRETPTLTYGLTWCGGTGCRSDSLSDFRRTVKLHVQL